MTDTTQGNAMTSTPVAPQQESAATGDGRGPSGMWWVAWRQHRFAILTSLTLMAIAAGALITFRLAFSTQMNSGEARDLFELCGSGAPENFSERCRAILDDRNTLDIVFVGIRVALLALPGVVGVLSGAVVFARERERGTHVLALTQSVSRTRWYWTKCLVVIVPITVGMVVVGLLTEWAADVYGQNAWDPFETPAFQLFGVVPALLTLLVLGVSLAAGAFFRSTLPAVVVALGLSIGAAGGIGYLGYLNVAPSDRVVGESIENTSARVPAGAIALDEGYLDSNGGPARGGPCPDDLGTATNDDTFAQCLESLGITNRYTDYVYGSRLTPWLSGISVLMAGAFLTLGAWRIRRRPL